MDADLAALVSAAATTLVTLMATDSWEGVKAAFVGLWRRHRPEQASVVEADLEAAQVVAAASQQVGYKDAIGDLTAEWRSRLRRAVEADAGFQAELQRLVEEFRPLSDNSAGPVMMTAQASGTSRIYQAGRDQTVISG